MRTASGTRGLTAMLGLCALAFPAAAWAGAAGDTTAMRGALEMMCASERAFALATSEIGVRNGFAMFFADDAISPPDSSSARARLLARPAPDRPGATTLTWEPRAGEVARSLDLGWLTGPFFWVDARGAKHQGVYFSIWRRGADGIWRVALDAGIDTPAGAPEFAVGAFRPAANSASGTDDAPAANAATLRRTEAEFLARAASDPGGAYAGTIASEVRLHRDGRIPLTERDSVVALAAAEPRLEAAHVVRAEVSAAGDLGWTFSVGVIGASRDRRNAGATRVWRRGADGQWRIAVDVRSVASD